MIVIVCDGIPAGMEPGTYDCTWRVISNFALLDIERERERERDSFYLGTFGYLLIINS